MASAESVKKFIQEIMSCERSGSSILIRDENTVILTDCEDLVHDQIDAIIQKYPSISIEYASTQSSKSGFVVIFSHWKTINIMKTSQFFQVIFCTLMVTIVLSYVNSVNMMAEA